ncbi:MAG: hypothetical protein J0L52_04070 [Caulobacterales bacterium]|nr:hypothetical protein [Caulobacterales bacterium]
MAGHSRLLSGVAVVSGLLVLGVFGSARAQETEPGRWSLSGNVAATSDYVFRGVSQSEGDAAVSVGADATDGVFYVGGWASSVAFEGDDDTVAEVDLYGGIQPRIGDWTFDVGVAGYLYLGTPDGFDYDYAEFRVGANRTVGAADLSVTASWSPDYFGVDEDEAFYLEAAAETPLDDRWTLSGAVGRQWVSSDFDYATWTLGVAYQLTDRLAVDVRYSDTDAHDFGTIYDGRAAVSLKAAF